MTALFVFQIFTIKTGFFFGNASFRPAN